MNKRQRIKKDNEFQKVFKEGKSFANRQFIVYRYKKEEQSKFRIGLSVSKKVGNAVTRNRIKRFVRQSFLEMKDEIQNDMDYIIIARHQTATINFHDTKESLQHVLRIARVLKRNKK